MSVNYITDFACTYPRYNNGHDTVFLTYHGAEHVCKYMGKKDLDARRPILMALLEEHIKPKPPNTASGCYDGQLEQYKRSSQFAEIVSAWSLERVAACDENSRLRAQLAIAEAALASKDIQIKEIKDGRDATIKEIKDDRDARINEIKEIKDDRDARIKEINDYAKSKLQYKDSLLAKSEALVNAKDRELRNKDIEMNRKEDLLREDMESKFQSKLQEKEDMIMYLVNGEEEEDPPPPPKIIKRPAASAPVAPPPANKKASAPPVVVVPTWRAYADKVKPWLDDINRIIRLPHENTAVAREHIPPWPHHDEPYPPWPFTISQYFEPPYWRAKSKTSWDPGFLRWFDKERLPCDDTPRFPVVAEWGRKKVDAYLRVSTSVLFVDFSISHPFCVAAPRDHMREDVLRGSVELEGGAG